MLNAQTLGREGSEQVRGLFRTLPVMRPLDVPPPVPEVGKLQRPDRGEAQIPVTAALAWADLRLYDAQLQSVFPQSGDDYPADSIKRLRVARAAEWMLRLGSLRARGDLGVVGWQLVPFARVAVQAGEDSLATILFEHSLQHLKESPAELISSLAVAVAAFADPEQEVARIRPNLTNAEAYARRLRAIVESTAWDRNSRSLLLTKQVWVEGKLVETYEALKNPESVLAHGGNIMALLGRADPNDRRPVLGVYRPMVLAYSGRPDEKILVQQLRERIMALARAIPLGWRATASSEERTGRLNEIAAGFRSALDFEDQRIAFPGTRADSIYAHAVINTTDSLYHVSPRAHGFRDGVIRVLALGNLRQRKAWPTLERINHWFPGRVAAVLVTETSGAVGPDLLSPEDEVTWLKTYYTGIRRFTMPIAVWAGSKVRQGEGMLPEESPAHSSSYKNRYENFVVVDGMGVVRAVMPGRTRTQEEAIRRYVSRLLEERVVDENSSDRPNASSTSATTLRE